MVAISLVFEVNEQISVTKSVSVIGWADGLASIFVAGKIGGTLAITGIIAGIVLLAIGIFIFARKNKFHFERVIRMKKIMFGNSLMLLGITLLILAGLEIMPIYVFWPAVILVLAGFMMAVIG